jgi:hypothetical protein
VHHLGFGRKRQKAPGCGGATALATRRSKSDAKKGGFQHSRFLKRKIRGAGAAWASVAARLNRDSEQARTAHVWPGAAVRTRAVC